MRLGLFEEMERFLKVRGITKWSATDIQERFPEFYNWLKAHIAAHPKDADLGSRLASYGGVAVAYDFKFDITENDNADAGLAFKLPFAKSIFDLSAGGELKLKRVAKRVFSAQETFAEMVTRNVWCGDFRPREKNLLHPITGSIGLRETVRTFVALSEQGGGKDQFVDTLTFTTTISGELGPKIAINPVPKSFRLVSASAALSADRTDLHMVTISLAFPLASADLTAMKAKKDKDKKQSRETGIVTTVPEVSDQGYPLSTVWRARYNICVIDARNREEDFKALRLSPPEVYCLTYADAFVPRYTDPRVQTRWSFGPSRR
jgi:hypothetical protein